MSASEIILIIFFSGFMINVFLAVVFSMMMLDQINDKRPPESQIPHRPFETSILPVRHHIIRKYRKVYPQGKLHIYLRAAVALVAICMIVLIVTSIVRS